MNSTSSAPSFVVGLPYVNHILTRLLVAGNAHFDGACFENVRHKTPRLASCQKCMQYVVSFVAKDLKSMHIANIPLPKTANRIGFSELVVDVACDSSQHTWSNEYEHYK